MSQEHTSAPNLNLGPPIHSSQDHDEDLAAGLRLGDHEIRRRIAAGGMGVIYEAFDTRLRRKVAIKVLRAHLQEATGGLLLDEARAAASLEHPRFVRVYALGSLPGGQPYLVMEFLRGSSLREHLLARPGAEGIAAVIGLFEGILDGTAHAHEQGIVHRDLKPENVFVTRRGEIKLLDLGLAGLAAEPVSSTVRAAELPVLAPGTAGTLPYMSPETLRGEKAGPWVDVWAIGVMLYEALSGQHPYWLPGAGLPANVARVLDAGPVTPLRQVQPDVPEAVAAVVSKALCKDRSGRYQTAGEMLAELRAPARRTGRVSRRALALAAVATAAVLGGTAVFLPHMAWWRHRDMVLIRGGSFMMGSSPDEVEAAYQFAQALQCDKCRHETYAREQPRRPVRVSSFYLDATEVTNRQFAAWLNRIPTVVTTRLRSDRTIEAEVYSGRTYLINLRPYYQSQGIKLQEGLFVPLRGFEQRPVTAVTWDGAVLYCQAQGRRLPTEAEWEYAARGRAGSRFPWGDDMPSCDGVAFGMDLQQPCYHAGARIWPVGQARQDRTELGVFDLGGNVMEWVQDVFRERYPACPSSGCSDPVVTDNEPGDGGADLRVVRGGSWDQIAESCRAAGRARIARQERRTDIGFRCAELLR